MISFSQPTLKLANRIRQHLSLKGIIPLTQSERVFVTNQTPLNLLYSASVIAPQSFGLVFIDAPRATTRSTANLLTINNDEIVCSKSFSLSDHDYRFHLAANILATAKLSKLCVDEDGVVIVTANTGMSAIVRGAFEIVFGYDGLVGELIYQTRSGGGNDSRHMSIDHETLMIFSANPAKVSRIMVPKSEKELKKYKEEDEKGRYYWDTYIRKQARNYYQILCPDDSVLELDENGNKISWLWREQTFKEKLSDGEIEFRKVKGQWRIYYKDRIKELKILRSIVLQKDKLADIVENYPEDNSGSELLTNKGSAEVKKFSEKPDYLKSSNYYKFILNIFAKESSRVLIPFPEYGSAILGLEGSVSEADIYTSVSQEWTQFFKQRTDDLFNNISFSNEAPINPIDSIESIDKEIVLNFFCEIVSVRKNLEVEFFDYKHDKNLMIRYALEDNHLFIISVTEDSSLGDALQGLITSLSNDYGVDCIDIYSQVDFDNSFLPELNIPVTIHGIIEEFIS